MELTEISVVKLPVGGDVNAINASQLYEFLGIKKDFSAWLSQKIASAEFVEGKHFTKNMVPMSAGRKKLEVFLTIEAAKRIAMATKGVRGTQARDYFIEIERRYLASQTSVSTTVMDLSNPDVVLALARRVVESAALIQQKDVLIQQSMALVQEKTELVQKREIVIAEQRPKVQAFDRLMDSSERVSITEAAKRLQMKPFALRDWMHEHGWIFMTTGRTPHWEPYQRVIDAGLMVLKTVAFLRSNDQPDTTRQALVTMKGLSKIALELGIRTMEIQTTLPGM
jgi:phage antirepressor YoqD-like protein/phage anti-repressor protein